MKKMIFLMLLSFLGITAGIKAQVTIGSTDDPRPGAVLDLNSTSQGLLLPQVALSTATQFLTTEAGDKAPAKGMLVYNTSVNLNGPGLYVWTGTKWQSLSGECAAPTTVPGTITFSQALTNPIPQNTLITATVPLTAGASSYTWAVPAGFEIVGNATGRSIQIRATQTGSFQASGITVKATNDCGSSAARAGVGTITVTAPEAVPATPTLTVNTMILSVGNTFTATCKDVGATSYNWTLPAGLQAPNGSQSYTTSTNSIEITAAATGYFYGITVSATNSQGTSAASNPTIGLIRVGDCAGKAPSDPVFGGLGSVLCVKGSTFNVSVRSVVSEGALRYEWSVPAGLVIVGDNTTQTITIEGSVLGTYNGSDISVKISNDCGDIVAYGVGTIQITVTGSERPELVGTNGTYSTYQYPNGLGTWMTQNSKEGNPAKKSYPPHGEGERGYYYTQSEFAAACPWDGWDLPTHKQLTDLSNYLSTSSVNEENASWITNAAGYLGTTAWDERGYWWGRNAAWLLYNVLANGFANGSYGGTTNSFSVRCIKTTCDEAPVVLSISGMSAVMPKSDAPIKIYANVRSYGNTNYEWHVPAGATYEAHPSAPDTIYVKFAEGIFTGNQLSVTVTNNCGSNTAHLLGETYTITGPGALGPPLTGTKGTYRTYVLPNNLGTFMIDWSKEGVPSATKYGDETEESKGYYYTFENAQTACPTGWSLPTQNKWWELRAFVFGLPEDHVLVKSFADTEQRIGLRDFNGNWLKEEHRYYLWGYGSTNNVYFHRSDAGLNGLNLGTNPESISPNWLPVRCWHE